MSQYPHLDWATARSKLEAVNWDMNAAINGILNEQQVGITLVEKSSGIPIAT